MNVVKVMQVRDEVGELLQMWSNCDWQRGGGSRVAATESKL
jgi:hypothetical protein